MSRQEPKRGEIYRHFNGTYYKIICVGNHSVTGERLVVYCTGGAYPPELCISPLDIFMSEVDHEKYPDATQKYIFEKVKYRLEKV